MNKEGELMGAIAKWKKLTLMIAESDGHVYCPECGDQIISCGCARRLAQEILETAILSKEPWPFEAGK